MTTQEFKKLCPEKSHLTGNDLWNAMEDYFIQHNQISIEKQKESILASNGQEIKEGDILQLYKIDKIKEHKYRMCFLDFSNNKKEIEYTPYHIIPNKNYLKEIFQEEVTVKNINGILSITIIDKINGITFISKYSLYNFLNFWYKDCLIKIKNPCG